MVTAAVYKETTLFPTGDGMPANWILTASFTTSVRKTRPVCAHMQCNIPGTPSHPRGSSRVATLNPPMVTLLSLPLI